MKPRQQIRFTGEDFALGERILAAGDVLHPPAISVLASFGRAEVAVYARPRVAILSTGDELIELGEPMSLGKVINSNAYSLAAQVLGAGAEPIILGIARDDPGQMRAKLIEGLGADALITSAGVSAGDRDYVRDVLADLHVQLLFREVKVKPGGPTAFGLKGGKPIFALPGNPVATMLMFEEMVRPALLKMLGHRKVLKAPITAILQEPLKKKPGKVQLLRVRLEQRNGDFWAWSAGDQNTGILKTMLRADGVAILPAEAISFSAGDELIVHLLSPEAAMMEESTLNPARRGRPQASSWLLCSNDSPENELGGGPAQGQLHKSKDRNIWSSEPEHRAAARRNRRPRKIEPAGPSGGKCFPQGMIRLQLACDTAGHLE